MQNDQANTECTLKRWGGSCGPRQLSALNKALGALLALRSTWVELSGVVGGLEDRAELFGMFGDKDKNPDASRRFLELGERFSWTITRENAADIVAAALEQVAEGRKVLPVVDNRRQPEEEAQRLAESRKRREEQDAREEVGRAAMRAVMAKRPPGASALIVAELEVDKCDAMSDYFATETSRVVAIGWRTGRKEDFRQLRRAAAGFAETRDLGPDAPDSIEHRDNYSMGAGNYLKAAGRYSTGWAVRSWPIGADGTVRAWGAALEDALPVEGATPASDSGARVEGAGFSILETRNKRGPFFLVVLADRVERADFERLRDSAKGAGGWYSRAWGKSPGGFGFDSRASAEAWTASEFSSAQPSAEVPAELPAALPTPAPDAPSFAGAVAKVDRCSVPGCGLDFATLSGGVQGCAVHGIRAPLKEEQPKPEPERAEPAPRKGGSVYLDALAAGLPISSHESDLYLPDTREAREICAQHGQEFTTFRDQTTGAPMLDAPFAYLPWWENRRPRSLAEAKPTPEPIPDEAPTAPKDGPREREAARLEELADRMQATIDAKRAPLSQNWTHRRARIKDGQRADADRLEETQAALRAIARAHRDNDLPGGLAGLRSKAAVEHVLRGYPRSDADNRTLAELQKLVERKGTKDEDARKARELEREKRERLDKLRGADVPGFFPTPPAVVARVVELAGLEPGRRYNILEPSAGIGSLAAPFLAHVKEHGGGIVACELRPTLCEVLEGEGYGKEAGTILLRGDCKELVAECRAQQMAGDGFDLVVMNPPFERRQDSAHVLAMLEHVNPGGRLLAIVTPRALEELQGCVPASFEMSSEPLPEGSFTGAEAFRQTGVRCELVTLERDR